MPVLRRNRNDCSVRLTICDARGMSASPPTASELWHRSETTRRAKGRHPACKGLSRYTSLHQESRVDASMRDPVPSLTARSI